MICLVSGVSQVSLATKGGGTDASGGTIGGYNPCVAHLNDPTTLESCCTEKKGAGRACHPSTNNI